MVGPVTREHPGAQGYSVVRAYTGQQALERARTAQPDLIILDAQMPDMHGFEVCRTLRERPADSAPRLPSSSPPRVPPAAPSGSRPTVRARGSSWASRSTARRSCSSWPPFFRCKREVDALREESLLDPGTGLYNMRGLARRARRRSGRRRSAGAIRWRAWCSRPSRRGGGRVEEPDEEAQRMADQVGLLFRQAGRSSDAIGRLGQSEFAVIAPATGPEAAVRTGPPARRCHRVLPRFPSAAASAAVRLRAGYCAVPDFAESSVDAVELLLRATTALRDLKREGGRRADPCVRAGARRSHPPEPTRLSVVMAPRYVRLRCAHLVASPLQLLDTRITV